MIVSEQASTMVVISGLAIRAGSSLIFLASSGSVPGGAVRRPADPRTEKSPVIEKNYRTIYNYRKPANLDRAGGLALECLHQAAETPKGGGAP